MFKNHLKIAWRNLIKHKGYSLLNITGLAVGVAAVILVFVYALDETSYDTVHSQHELVFGMGEEFTTEEGEKYKIPAAPSGWGNLLKEQVPGVVETLRVFGPGYPHSIRNPEDNKTILTQDSEIFLVDGSFGKVLHFPLLYGNVDQVLSEPNGIVLSEKAAERLFGSIDVVGRTLEIKNIFIAEEYAGLKVTGVIKNYPNNSHIRPDYLLSMKFLNTSPTFQELIGMPIDQYLSNLDGAQMATYIKLAEGADIRKIETNFERVIADNLQEKAKQHNPVFRNITDFHFDEFADWSWWDSTADFDYIIVFSWIGLIILLIASINYMNLATARSLKRSKEVGLKKSLGCSRKNLMVQFFQESFLTSLIALMFALVLIGLALPTFNVLADKHFTITTFFRKEVLLGLLLIWLAVAFIAGSYPAIFLSGFRPIEVLNGKLIMGKGPTLFRKTLVVVQLTVSVLLIISTGVILRQMNMMQSTKLYAEADQVVSIRYGGSIAPIERYNSLKNEILNDPDITDVTLSVHLPQRWGPWVTSYSVPTVSGEQEHQWNQLPGDYDFPKVFDLEFIAGRSFKTGNSADSTNVILNEAAARNLNKTPNEIIGTSLVDLNTKESGTIIGVVKDFPYESIHANIKPMAILGKPNAEDQILYAKVPADKLQEKLAMLESKWEMVLPGVGFDYWFLSDEFGRMYHTEQKMANLVQFFSILALFIACLGLYGLSSFMSEQKTKEIGVRKILGATVPNILLPSAQIHSDFEQMCKTQ